MTENQVHRRYSFLSLIISGKKDEKVETDQNR